jgi:hypothetical protein
MKGDGSMGQKYTADVRSTILERYKSGESVSHIATSACIARSTIYKECQGDGSLDNFLFIVYSVPEVIHRAEKSQNAE